MQAGWTSQGDAGSLGRYRHPQPLMPYLPISLHPWLSSLPIVAPLRAGSFWDLGIGTLPALMGKKGWVLSETDHLGWGRALDPQEGPQTPGEGVNHHLLDEESRLSSTCSCLWAPHFAYLLLPLFQSPRWVNRSSERASGFSESHSS